MVPCIQVNQDRWRGSCRLVVTFVYSTAAMVAVILSNWFGGRSTNFVLDNYQQSDIESPYLEKMPIESRDRERETTWIRHAILSTKFLFHILMDAIIFFTLNELVDQRVGYLRRLLYSVPYSLKFIISFHFILQSNQITPSIGCWSFGRPFAHVDAMNWI